MAKLALKVTVWHLLSESVGFPGAVSAVSSFELSCCPIDRDSVHVRTMAGKGDQAACRLRVGEDDAIKSDLVCGRKEGDETSKA